ncbi:MAG: GAF and ANTAR domain-containing protein [Acidobacteria bacterium]|nr:GAF and ANTAR domain-containing protein [Acidobacteriota bacterium]
MALLSDKELNKDMNSTIEEPTTASMDPVSSQVNLMHRISNIVASELSLDEMLGEIIGLTAQVTNCDAALVYLMDLDTNEIVLRASQVPHAKDLGNLRMKVGEGITGWVAEHKSVVTLPKNAAQDARFKRFQALVEDTYEAFLSVPLVNRGEVIGVVNVHHRQSYDHTPEEVSLVTFIGEQMGSAIGKSVLEDQNSLLREQLETRKLVERAKGILQNRHSLTEEEAYLRLRNESRRLRRPMKELAEAIILSEELARKPEA